MSDSDYLYFLVKRVFFFFAGKRSKENSHPLFHPFTVVFYPKEKTLHAEHESDLTPVTNMGIPNAIGMASFARPLPITSPKASQDSFVQLFPPPFIVLSHLPHK